MEGTPFTYIDSVARKTAVVEKRTARGDRPTASYHWMRWTSSSTPAPRRAR